MAIEVLPDGPKLVMSPRISFSHDLQISPDNVVPIEKYLRSNNPSIDFDFCVFNENSDHNTSADELFSGGKILPTQIKKPQPPLLPRLAKTAPPSPQPKPISESEEKHLHGGKASSFWGYKRSASLNDPGRGMCTQLPLLSRSNSTGSYVKRPSNTKQSVVRSSSCSQQKPPLKKGNQASYCYGVKIHPVLNVPPVNLFGLGSIFSYNGTNKSKKKGLN